VHTQRRLTQKLQKKAGRDAGTSGVGLQ